MKQLKMFINLAEILENNKVILRINRDEKGQPVIDALVASGEYTVLTVNESPDLSLMPADGWDSSLQVGE